ncbi:hypothetical protein M4D52_12665 [Paenibacillus lactis]|uniref:hypothetical protein n=1 Tax=Paenibacillus lactis TaxID=228574 RepID=UPI00203FA812|nr:hypothetical protein [Paenibacillus lactis]MCM3494286.1 hypothetical protein [Paenibacillus lactis]
MMTFHQMFLRALSPPKSYRPVQLFTNVFLTFHKAAFGLKSILHFLPALIIKALSGFRKPSYFSQLDFFPAADVKIAESLDIAGFLAV